MRHTFTQQRRLDREASGKRCPLTDRVLIPFNGTLLALTSDQFIEAQHAAREICPVTASVSTSTEPSELLTAEQLERLTSVPASWWEQAARERRVPHARIGRYVRFRFSDIADQFSQPSDSDSRGAIRQWRKSRT